LHCAALFSGGKDSLYALYLAEKQGFIIDHLITLRTTLPWPSPHAENIEALELLARSMKKHLTIVDFQKENALIDALKSLEVDALIAGDINVEAHLLGLEDVCAKVGLKLIEPIYGRDTSELFNEIFSLGFKALITGVNLDYLGEEWLGFIISNKTGVEFLRKIGKIDPLGENGEFHTLVIECPLYTKSFEIKSIKKKTEKNMAYMKVIIA
jgi:uncharacterized protein (TIGR00290 family)